MRNTFLGAIIGGLKFYLLRKMMKKLNKKKKVIIAIDIAILALAGALIAFYNYKTDLVYSEVTIEAGNTSPDVAEFLKHQEDGVSFADGTSFDVNVPGDYDIDIVWSAKILGVREYQTVLHVVDTTAPVIELSEDEISVWANAESVNAEDYVASVSDVTECKVEFKEDYDFTKQGDINAVIVATDTSGNVAEETLKVNVVDDTTPPVFVQTVDMEVAMGDSVSYKKAVTVEDDYDENPEITVDSSQVKLTKRGTYKVYFTATDASGNSSKASINVHVVASKLDGITMDEVNAKADEVLASILRPGMSQKEQAKAIYDYVVNSITYMEMETVDDILSGAYRGLFYKRGDCTVNQKTAEVLLNRAGIKNMEIQKIPDTRGHYWLLIDVGEGWYHYDAIKQLDGTQIFYWHDADLWNFSNSHKNTHNYDPSKYPTIQ